ncbi:2-hydroxyacid dehydrogenase [Sulfolobales archaeon HS-7]|nr:2-hydroxyacid dehydrogenase [Sulfolobales archaeon HS-7]
MFLHISDTHLGKRPYGKTEREGDIYDSFKQLVDIAINERVSFVIHSGDFFDVYEPSAMAYTVAIENLKRLKEANIPFFVIPGNHDLATIRGKGLPLRVLEVVGLVKVLDGKEKTSVFSGINIYGIKYSPTREAFVSEVKGIVPSGKSVLMIHQGLKEYLPFNGSYQIEESELPKGFTYYALGHVHTRKYKRFNDGSLLALPSSPDILDVREIEDYRKNGKGGFLVDLSKDEPYIQQVNVDVREQLLIWVRKENIKSEIDKELASVSSKKLPLIHLILHGEPIEPKLLTSVMKQFSDRIYWWRVEKDETEISKDIKLFGDTSQENVTSLTRKYLLAQGYTEEESNAIIDLIESAEDEEESYAKLKRFLGIQK